MAHHKMKEKWCRREDLNPQPTDYKSVALPIELPRRKVWKYIKIEHAGIVTVILTSESLCKQQLGQYAEVHSGSLFGRALPIELPRRKVRKKYGGG